MNILGIDPSLSSTGWAIVDSARKIVAFGKIETTAKANEFDRMNYIKAEILEILKKNDVQAVYIEKSILVRKNNADKLSGLNYVLCCSIWHSKHLVIRVNPMLWKKLFKIKGAREEQKLKAIDIMNRRYKTRIKNLNNGELLEKKDNDIADAICIALYGLQDIKGEEE